VLLEAGLESWDHIEDLKKRYFWLVQHHARHFGIGASRDRFRECGALGHLSFWGPMQV